MDILRDGSLMKTKEHLIYFQDEAPMIGSGWRRVTVKKGRKWVYLASKYGKKKLSMKRWKMLESLMINYHKRNGESSLDTFQGETL